MVAAASVISHLEAAISLTAAAESHHDYSTCDETCCQLVSNTLDELLMLRQALEAA